MTIVTKVESQSQLSIESLKALPETVHYVRVGENKIPWEKEWQTKEVKLDEVLGDSRTRAIGINLGEISGGIIAVDHDAFDDSGSLEKFLDQHVPGHTFPKTPTVTSGKPGRRTPFYRIPKEHWPDLQGITYLYSGRAIYDDKGKVKKAEQIEFRWDGHQQVVVGEHPETGSYQWITRPDECEITEAPEWIIDVLKGKYKALADKFKPKAKRSTVETPKPKPVKNNDWNVVLDDRARDEKLALEILAELPQTENGTGTYPDYREIACALKNILGEDEAIGLLESHSPKRNWKQIVSSSKGSFDMGSIVHHAKQYIPGWNYPDWWKNSFPKGQKPYYHDTTKPQLKPAKDWQEEVKKLAYSDLSNGELERKKTAIATDNKLQLQSVEKVYQSFVVEREREENKDSTKAELDQLIKANSDSLDLNTILPSIIANPINQLAKDIGLRPETYLTALLPAASSCLDPRLKITIAKKTGFVIRGGLYSSMVALSSQGKSPVTNEIINKPFKVLQRDLHAEYLELQKQYQREEKRYQDAIKAGEDMEEPTKPNEVLTDVSNFTVERLKDILAYQQDKKGLLATYDELAALFGGLNQYKGGKGSDRQDILSLYDGNGFSVERKGGSTRAEQCSLSIFGCSQPSVLGGLMNSKNGISDGDGLWSRFIFVNQPPTPILLPDEDDSHCTVATELTELYRNLMQVGERHLTLSKEAYRLFKEVTDRIELEKIELGEHPLANALGKQRGRIGKFCALLHCIDWAMGDDASFDPVVSVDVMRRALALNRFYDGQLRSIYAQLDNSSRSLAPELLKLLSLKPKGSITVRDATRKLPKLKAGDILPLFSQLESLGYGTVIHHTPPTGRPTIKFEFCQTSDSFVRVSSDSYVKTQNYTGGEIEVSKCSFDSFDITFDTSLSTNTTENLKPTDPSVNNSFDKTIYDKTDKTDKTPQTVTGQGLPECQNSDKTPDKTPTSDKTLTIDEVSQLKLETKVWTSTKGLDAPCYFSGWNDSGVGQLLDVDGQWMEPIKRAEVEAGLVKLSLIA